MVTKSRIQKQFVSDNFVPNVIQNAGNLPMPAPKRNVGRVGNILPTKVPLTIGIATLIAFTLIGLISNPVFGAGVWRKRASMPTPRFGLTTAVVSSKIYAIGGGKDANLVYIPTVEMYDAVTNAWTKKANMLTPRGFFGASVVEGKIYAIGGGVSPNKMEVVATVEEYNPVTDTWTKKADMPTPRGGLSTAVVNGKIYAIGGVTNDKTLSVVEEYNPATNTWTKRTNMPTSRGQFAISVVNEKIYVIGGYAQWPPVKLHR